MLQAERFIDLEALRDWAQSWDESPYISYFDAHIQERAKRIQVRSSMEENIYKVKKLLRDLDENAPFSHFLRLLDRIAFNCYLKVRDSALRMGNFHEEIIEPADHQTYLRFFGFQDGQRHPGELAVSYEGQKIGQMGEQSDLFHLVFDACFLTENEFFDEKEWFDEDLSHHFAISNSQDRLLTLKIWAPDQLNMPLDDFVDLFLFQCSRQHGLNFKRGSFASPINQRAMPLRAEVNVKGHLYDKLPLLAFNSASHHLPPQIVFMSYYQCFAHFFERAVQELIRGKMQSMFDLQDTEDTAQLRRMAKAIVSLRESYSEKESLALVIHPLLEKATFREWLETQPEDGQEWFTQAQADYPELPIVVLRSERSLKRSVVERIYAIKATLEGSHEKRDHFIWLEHLDEGCFERETPLIKHLAAESLAYWSEKG